MYEVKESAQLKTLLFRLTMLSVFSLFYLDKANEEFILGIEQVWFYQLIDYIMRGVIYEYILFRFRIKYVLECMLINMLSK